MTQTMQYMMPLMFGFFALSFSAALSIYFVVSNLIGVVQYAAINRWFRDRWEKESGEQRQTNRRAKQSSPALAESGDGNQPATRKRRKKKRVKR